MAASKVGWSAVGAFALALVGCAPHPPKVPGEGGPAWSELTSEHFVLCTNLDRADATETSAFLEQTYDMLESLMFTGVRGPSKVLVVDFESESELEAFGPAFSGGRMTLWPPNDLEPEPLIVSGGRPGDAGSNERLSLVHELTHYFIHASGLSGVPTWFDEGLADYFSTVSYGKHGAVLGAPPPNAYVSRDALPPVEQLVAANTTTFYAGASFDGVAERRRQMTAGYYAGAWWLVHMLRNGPTDLTRRFDDVLDLWKNGASFTGSWNETFGEDDYGALDARFRKYVTGRDLRVVQTNYFPHAVDPPRVRAISDRDVYLLWARLLKWDAPEGWRSWEQLDAATKLDPHSAAIAYWWGAYRIQKKNYRGAIPLFRHAVALEPKNPRYLFGLARAEGALLDDDAPEEDKLAFARTMEALAPIAETAVQLESVARYRSSRGDNYGAAVIAKRSSELDPSCARCQATRASIAFRIDDFEEAVRYQKRAIALYPPSADTRALEETLDRYETALEDHAGTHAPAVGPPPDPPADPSPAQ